jgi:hypothetical protein
MQALNNVNRKIKKFLINFICMLATRCGVTNYAKKNFFRAFHGNASNNRLREKISGRAAQHATEDYIFLRGLFLTTPLVRRRV